MASTYLAKHGEDRVDKKLTLPCRSPRISMELPFSANAAIAADA